MMIRPFLFIESTAYRDPFESLSMCPWNIMVLSVKPTTNLAESISPDGATLLLQEHDGEYFLKIGGVPLMSTTAAASEQEMATLA